MAIGTTAAIIGGSALGLGGSVLSARSQSRAAQTAADASQASTDAQIDFQREVLDSQLERSEPFHQIQLQQANALGEIFGFNPVGDTAPQQPQQQQPARDFNDVVSRFGGGVGGGRFGSAPSGLFNRIAEQADGSSSQAYLSSGQYGAPQRPPQAAQQPVAQSGFTDAQGQPLQGQDAARARFEGSMFNDVYREGHARDVDRIDAGLGASGLAFSGARMQAVEDARADRFGQTFNNYFSGLMGQAPQSASNNQNAASGAFAANAGNAIAQNGQAQQQSAYQRGNANANLWGGVASLGGYAAGGGFS